MSKYVSANQYIKFSLDLRKINFPDKYSIIFGTWADYYIDENSCHIEDISQFLPIPPPNYIVTPIITTPLILYPNDEEKLDLQIHSNSQTGSTIYLKSVQDNTTTVTFSPDILVLNSNEKGISKVKIKTNNSPTGTHTILLSANVTFPKDIEVNIIGEKKNILTQSVPISL